MSEVAVLAEHAGTLNDERIAHQQRAWKRIGTLHVRLVQYYRVPRDLGAAGISYDLRPALIRRVAEPAAGDEEQHAWRRVIAFRRATVRLLHYLVRSMLILAELTGQDSRSWLSCPS